ncbi:seryl-tRNA synthetase family protein [Streptococcus pneumoniae]|nr:seryl-tRNA synthetase family protein [Streptococcus pneumoniae]
MAEFTFEIEEHLLTLSENEKGWTKEINRVSFNGAPAKFDIRAWSPDHTKMGKGITLSNEEFQTMVDAFKGNSYSFENLFKPRQLCLTVCMVTDFVSSICNLKTLF